MGYTMAKEQLYGIVKDASHYENTKKFLYVDCCNQCMHKNTGQEAGGALPAGSEEKDIWYFCFHPDFAGWPKRIGQVAEIKTTVPAFCPLESIVKEEDLSVRKGKRPKVETASTTQAPQSQGLSAILNDSE